MELDTSIIQPLYKNKKSTLNKVLTSLVVLVFLIFAAILIFVSLTVFGKVSGSSMENTLHDGDYLLLSKNPKHVQVGDIVILPMPNENMDIIKRVIATEGEYIRFVQFLNDDPTTIQDERQFVYLQKWVGESWDINDNADLQTIEYAKQSHQLSANWQTVDESGYIKEPMLSSFFASSVIAAGTIDGNGVYYPSSMYLQEQDVLVDMATIVIKKGFVFVMGDNRNNSRDSRQVGQMRANTILGRAYHQLKHGTFEEWFFKVLYREH